MLPFPWFISFYVLWHKVFAKSNKFSGTQRQDFRWRRDYAIFQETHLQHLVRCRALRLQHQSASLDLVNARVMLPRIKTGILRDLPLWPETVESLEKIPKTGKLVFYTSRGNPYIQTFLKPDGNGKGKYTTLNTITTKFSRLIKKSGLDVPRGTGFYTLRRTAATIAARSGDPFAVQRLLGHADLQMATRYVQDVSPQTDRVIENSRIYVCQISK